MDFKTLIESSAHPNLVNFAGYCEDLAAGRRMPQRQDFRLSEVPWMFGRIFLVNVLRDEDDYYFSLFGVLMSKMYGADFTGQKLSQVADVETRKTLRGTYDTVVATEAPFYTPGKYRWPNQEIEVERLLVPLSDADGRMTTILGAVHTDVPVELLILYAGQGAATFVPGESAEPPQATIAH